MITRLAQSAKLQYVQIVDSQNNSLGILPQLSKGSGEVTYQDLYRTAERNARGEMVKNFIRTLTGIKLKYSMLSPREYHTIIEYFRQNRNFRVNFFDPLHMGRNTLTMYVGDRSASPNMVDNQGMPKFYTDITFNFIEV